jgi:alpha-L-arabinofuranosidase
VNRALEPGGATLEFGRPLRGDAILHRIEGDDVGAVNGFDDPDRVGVRTSRIATGGGQTLWLELAPHSVVYVEATVA